jgi:hypothetical protein
VSDEKPGELEPEGDWKRFALVASVLVAFGEGASRLLTTVLGGLVGEGPLKGALIPTVIAFALVLMALRARLNPFATGRGKLGRVARSLAVVGALLCGVSAWAGAQREGSAVLESVLAFRVTKDGTCPDGKSPSRLALHLPEEVVQGAKLALRVCRTGSLEEVTVDAKDLKLAAQVASDDTSCVDVTFTSGSAHVELDTCASAQAADAELSSPRIGATELKVRTWESLGWFAKRSF